MISQKMAIRAIRMARISRMMAPAPVSLSSVANWKITMKAAATVSAATTGAAR